MGHFGYLSDNCVLSCLFFQPICSNWPLNCMKKQLETLSGVHLTRQMEHFPKPVGFISYIHLEKNRQTTFGTEDPVWGRSLLKSVLMSLLSATLNVGQANVLLFLTTNWTSWKHCRLNVCQCPCGEAQCATVFNSTWRKWGLSCPQCFASSLNEGILPSAEKKKTATTSESKAFV